jgi:hypothetical protein
MQTIHTSILIATCGNNAFAECCYESVIVCYLVVIVLSLGYVSGGKGGHTWRFSTMKFIQKRKETQK